MDRAQQPDAAVQAPRLASSHDWMLAEEKGLAFTSPAPQSTEKNTPLRAINIHMMNET